MAVLSRNTEMTIGERTIEAGEEIRIAGLQGRFRFLAHVAETAGTERVDVYGPNSTIDPKHGKPKTRSFTIDRIRLLPKGTTR